MGIPLRQPRRGESDDDLESHISDSGSQISDSESEAAGQTIETQMTHFNMEDLRAGLPSQSLFRRLKR